MSEKSISAANWLAGYILGLVCEMDRSISPAAIKALKDLGADDNLIKYLESYNSQEETVMPCPSND